MPDAPFSFRRYDPEHDEAALIDLFVRGGYVKEAVYRDAWPGGHGRVFDGIGYAILRRDWETGTTTPIDWSDL